MSENILLNLNPRIEFKLHKDGFTLFDGQTKNNSGFYPYTDVRSIELNKVWFPSLAKWLRLITWVLNGVPYFPDAESCKKANLIIHSRKHKLGFWLTSSNMADKARNIKILLDEKSQLQSRESI